MQAINQGKKKLLVLGGGFGGLGLIRKLQTRTDLIDKLQITLVDKKEYFENPLAAARSLTVPNFHSQMLKKYTDYLDTTGFICGEVKSVNHTPKEVSVNVNGQNVSLTYDYLVVCLGTSYRYFKAESATVEQRSEDVNNFLSKLQQSNHIMIVGGRGIGVELVGELAENFPNKKITLVHSRSSLMDIWPEAASELVHDYVHKHNVNLLLNKRLLRSEGNLHYFTDGTSIEADCKIETMGGTPNTSSFVQNFSSSLSNSKYLKINDFQQLLGHNNIFVLGDICDVSLNRNAILIKYQVPTVENNITALINSEPFVKFTTNNFPLDYPLKLAIGAEWGISVDPINNIIKGDKKIGHHMTKIYHHYVNMYPQDFEYRYK